MTIEIENAHNVSAQLSDLLCWWEGFKMGLKASGENPGYIVAENGIETARELNIQIQQRLTTEDLKQPITELHQTKCHAST